jgi:hypothetical protein
MVERKNTEHKRKSNNKDLIVRVVKVGEGIDKIVLHNYIINENPKTIYDGHIKKEVPKNIGNYPL